MPQFHTAISGMTSYRLYSRKAKFYLIPIDMLLKFTLANYRSFNDPVSLCLQTPNPDELSENIFCGGSDNLPVSLFKSVILLGANGVGKSNLFSGFGLMRSLVMNSAIETAASNLCKVQPFRLN